jgi:hypothetical protein
MLRGTASSTSNTHLKDCSPINNFTSPTPSRCADGAISFNDLGYADSTIQHLHDFLGSAGAGVRIAYGRFTLDGFFAFRYGNLASRVGSPTFYLTGRAVLF